MPNSPPSAAPLTERSVFQVQELVSTLKHGLEMNFPALWVEGEISNFIAARSGHWYFTLKDQNAQIRCAFFRNRNLRKKPPANGQRCLLYARPSIFVARGELQLIIEDIEDAGAGALHLAFERLKHKLQDEGLFDPGRKRTVPDQPRCIGLLTSPIGAALHDVLSTLRRRNRLSRVILYPIPVQGRDAPRQIIQMLHTAERRGECDALLLTRGGGSLEDLQAFNDEALARCIAALNTPLVAAVGHEVDFSIADFVADERAATPTGAAERLSQNQADWHERIDRNRRQLTAAMQQRQNHARQQRQHLHDRLSAQSPGRQLQDRMQQLDDWHHRLQQSMQKLLRERRIRLDASDQRLAASRLQARLSRHHQELESLRQRLARAMHLRLARQQMRLDHARQRLDELHPDHTLKRGYSIVWDGDSIVRKPVLQAGTPLRVQMAEGDLRVAVSEKN